MSALFICYLPRYSPGVATVYSFHPAMDGECFLSHRDFVIALKDRELTDNIRYVVQRAMKNFGSDGM